MPPADKPQDPMVAALTAALAEGGVLDQINASVAAEVAKVAAQPVEEMRAAFRAMVPGDTRVWPHPGATRLPEDVEHFASFLREDRGNIHTYRANKRDLSTLDDELGGYLVPTQFYARVMEIASERSILLNRGTVIPTASRTLQVPRLNQSTNAYGGVTTAWVEEAADISASKSDAKFEMVTLTPHKLVAATLATEELIEMAALDLVNYLSLLLGRATAYAVDYALLRGAGGGQPLGVINQPAAVVPQVARTTAGTVTYTEDYVNLVAALAADEEPLLIQRREGFLSLLKARNDQGTLEYSPRENGFDPATGTARILLWPAASTRTKLPAVGTAGDLVAIVAEFLLIAMAKTLAVSISDQVAWWTDKLAFKAVGRVDATLACKGAAAQLVDAEA